MSVATASPQAREVESPVVAPPARTTPAPPDHPSWSMPLAVYEKMVEAGLLEDYRHVYLWDGRLCERMGINRPHIHGVKSLFLALVALCADDFAPETEAPVAFRHHDSAPQPDIKVLRGRTRDYMNRMPSTADVALVVEVTDTTLSKDRGLVITYAIEEIPVYWLLNIPSRRLEVYAAPVAGVYTSVAFFEADADAPVVLDGRDVGRIRVADLLP